jgi:hypothetical protein
VGGPTVGGSIGRIHQVKDRAEIIRGRLKLFPKPDMGKVAPEPDNETPSESNNNE